MTISSHTGVYTGTLARLSVIVLLALICTPSVDRSAFAAIIPDGRAHDVGAAALAHPVGVAADSLGNFYVVDSSKNRVVKFLPGGGPKLIFGKYGQGDGELSTPQGIGVGTHSNGTTLVYVADSFNNRITVFDDNGAYVGKFGDTGPGALNSPVAVAILKNKTSDGGLVFVADHRNNRVVVFTDGGAFVKSFQCGTCPGGGIRPLGIAARYGADGSVLIYAADELTGLVQVINRGGGWVRTIGSRGSGPGQVGGADDVAVDEDGSVYVADGAIGTERISKFGPGGTFLFSFDSNGTDKFISPHGIWLDQQGKLYVAVTGLSDVYRFREEAPRLDARLFATRTYWINTKGAWFTLTYNGIEQTCRGGGSATVRAPAGPGGQAFTVDGGPVSVDFEGVSLKMDMTAFQAGLAAKAWQAGKTISISVKLQARCQDGTLIQKTLNLAK